MEAGRDLTHLDADGHARMVDVGEKAVTARVAGARAVVRMRPETAVLLAEGRLPKGDALAAARIAGIMGAKRTPDLLPLAHPIALAGVEVEVEVDVDAGVAAIATRARAADRTGVEMEALTAAAVAALTLYDMVKAVERGVIIERIELVSKTGGRSGDWHRDDPGGAARVGSARDVAGAPVDTAVPERGIAVVEAAGDDGGPGPGSGAGAPADAADGGPS